MTDNTAEEDLNNPTNTQSENPPDEIINTNNKEINTQNLETENMEVHKHPHHVMHKKKWGEYLLEFFMLFLAVFLGFVAENIREASVERHQEKEYMRLLVEDLKKDTANINTMVNGNVILIKGLDTLLDLVSGSKLDPSVQRRTFIYALKYTYWYMPIQFSELTLTQLKSSGGFRLIKDKKITSAILQYGQGLDACKYNFDLLLHYYHTVEATNKELFNMTLGRKAFKETEKNFHTVFLPYDEFEKLVPIGNYLDRNDPALFSKYHDDILYYETTLTTLTNIVANQKTSTDSLIQLIKKNYHIDD
jgi:hypothetical protein